MCWQVRRVYYSDWGAPRLARGLAADHLVAALGHSRDAQAVVDAVAVVSELVTNAVNAGSTSIEVELDLHREHLRIAVDDDAPGEPEPRSTTGADVRGRGLQVVSGLVDSWGVGRHGRGKEVWAELLVPIELTDSLNCSVTGFA